LPQQKAKKGKNTVSEFEGAALTHVPVDEAECEIPPLPAKLPDGNSPAVDDRAEG
jgi:hypothetical protein